LKLKEKIGTERVRRKETIAKRGKAKKKRKGGSTIHLIREKRRAKRGRWGRSAWDRTGVRGTFWEGDFHAGKKEKENSERRKGNSHSQTENPSSGGNA